MRRKISPKFHVKNGVKNGKFHVNFTLLGRSAEAFWVWGGGVPILFLWARGFFLNFATTKTALGVKGHCRSNSRNPRLFSEQLSELRSRPKSCSEQFSEQLPELSEVSKRVGGQRGLAQGDPCYARDSDLFSVPFFLGEGEHNSGVNFCCICGPVSRQPPPANPFRNLRHWLEAKITPKTLGAFSKLGRSPRMRHKPH